MRAQLWWLGVMACGCGSVEALRARAIVGPLPSAEGVEPGRPIDVTARDGVPLHGFVVPAEGSPRGVVVLLHGLGARASFWADEALALSRAGYHAVALDARGHGRSGGLITYGAHERDDLAPVLDALERAGLSSPRILLFGYSMGAAVAIQTAAREPRVTGVLAVAPFTTLEGAIHRALWPLPRSVTAPVMAAAERAGRFQVAEVRPVADARRLVVPLVVVVGTLDDRAPLSDAEALVRAAGGPSTLLRVTGAAHDDLMQRCGLVCEVALGDLAAQTKTGAPAGAPVSR